MYQEHLREIAAQIRADGDEMQPPCSVRQLQRLRNQARAELRTEIPEAYAHFLQLHNGLDWNGLMVYATEKVPIVGYEDRFIFGCVEANLSRRDVAKMKQFLIFGETGDEEYCLETAKSQYVVLDSASTDVLETFPSFDELIAEALQRRL